MEPKSLYQDNGIPFGRQYQTWKSSPTPYFNTKSEVTLDPIEVVHPDAAGLLNMYKSLGFIRYGFNAYENSPVYGLPSYQLVAALTKLKEQLHVDE